MLTRNEILRDLLQKLNELCEKANAKYVLHGQAAFLAYYNKPIDQINSLEVLMCQGDAERAFEFLDDDAYYYEDGRTNPKFDRSFMLFGYKNSVDLKRKELNFFNTRYIDNNCIRITIHFIEQPLTRFSGQVLKNSRKLLKFKNMEGDYNFRNFKSKRKVANGLFKVINDDFYNKKVYNFKKKNLSIDKWDDIKKYPEIKITGKKVIESDLFDSILPVELDGISTFIIKDFERYAKHYFGKDWKNKKWAKVNRLSSSIVSWEEYSKDPEVQEKIAEIQTYHDMIYQRNAKISEKREAIKNMKRQIKMSESVVYTREEILPQKDKILELNESGNMKELGIVLEPLIDSLTKGTNRGYTYSVDEEIDEIVDSYLRKTDETELANEIKKLRVDV